MNTFGDHFRIHSFGESHGAGLGVVIDGCPAGVQWMPHLLTEALKRRRPGQVGPDGNIVVTSRNETDEVEVLSGVFEGKTLGSPIAMLVRNQDQRSQDYNPQLIRQGHADDVWQSKFGHRDHRGGGRSSGRETVSRVMAGAVAEMLVRQVNPQVEVIGYSAKIGEMEAEQVPTDRVQVESAVGRCPTSQDVATYLLNLKERGESVGGVARVQILNPSSGWGEPVFGKLKSKLAAAMLSIGASSGFQLGPANFDQAGSEFHQSEESYGGIRGGISTGETISFEVRFKPTSSIMEVAKKGRHDPCIVPRAVPVVEAMTWLVLADALLAQRLNQAEWSR